jgi:hypothetical protein
MKHPIELMGPKSYTSLVQLLIGFDKAIAATKENHVAAVAANDEIAADKFAQGVESLKEMRGSVEDMMRRIEPGEVQKCSQYF